MEAAVRPPLPPMLARLVREMPRDGYLYEPKWDGFRCLAFRDGDDVDLRSRNDRRLARYFPELVGALRRLRAERFVLDGEIVVPTPGGFDFETLLARLHPAASRVERLRRETPASFVAFDLVAEGDEDLRPRPFSERRTRLEALVLEPSGVLLTPITDDADLAEAWLRRFRGGGIDGVMAKQRDQPYQPGRRAMVKVKLEQTADCVVAGFRVYANVPMVASLLLGLYRDDVLHHVGVAAAFSDRRRLELFRELQPLVTPLEGHPWEHGFVITASRIGHLAGAAGRWTPEDHRDWVPVRPELVCEVGYDQIDAGRFRHAARFRRWRPDRDPRSCTFEQIATPPLDPWDVLEIA